VRIVDYERIKLLYEKRRQLWLIELDKFCKKHHELTKEQALSVLGNHAFDGLLWNEFDEFVEDTIIEMETNNEKA
jgi:hypothetical protein